MFSSLIFFAALQVACALSIDQPRGGSNNFQARSANLQKRGMATGVKVALGICIPCAALVVILGLVILWGYPAQLRKYRRENPGAQVGLAELMNGKVTQHPAPPPYNAHHTPTINKPSSEATDLPSYELQPKSESHAAPPTEAEARHAALMS
jgi:hypothetical protein